MERPNHWLTRVADRVEKRVLRDPEKGEGATIVSLSRGERVRCGSDQRPRKPSPSSTNLMSKR